MPTPRTDQKLAKALRRIRKAQASGEGPLPGEWSRAALARRCGVSEETILNMERLFQARLAAAILADPASPKPLLRAAAIAIAKL